MLLTSVIIVLREVLEASLLISILAAVSDRFILSRIWIAWALSIGLTGAVLYSLGINTVSEWFDGVGQEIISATIQLLVYILLVGFAVSILRHKRNHNPDSMIVPVIMMLTIALAISREGSEILIYIFGFSSELPQLINVVLGAVIGAGIGISAGVLLYYLLTHPAIRRYSAFGIGLLALMGAGILSQATLLLIQADWIPSQLPLWNTSDWLAENSVTGQLLYVLIGYEATPTAVQTACYFGGLLVLVILAVLIAVTHPKSSNS